MLDNFLMVAYEAEKKASVREEMVAMMKHLPVEELHKIAQGKIAHISGGDCESWLDRYKGTPLFEQALELQQQELQLEAQSLQKRLAKAEQRQAEQAQEAAEPDTYDQQAVIGLKKRMLDLQLISQTESGAGMSPPPAEAPVAAPVDPVKQASANFDAALEKMAKARPEEEYDYEIEDGILRGLTPEQAQELARNGINGTADTWKGKAEKATKHPVQHRLGGAAGGAVVGGLLGTAAGALAGRPGMGALAGGALGAGAGALLRSPQRTVDTATSLEEARQALMQEGALQGAMKNRALEIASSDPYRDDEGGLYGYDGGARRQALMYLLNSKQASAIDEAEVERAKEAFGAAIMQGLKGAGSALAGAASTAKGAYTAAGGGRAGLSAVGTLAKPLGQALVNRGANFAAANPAAAGAIGAGAVGTAALGGAAVG